MVTDRPFDEPGAPLRHRYTPIYWHTIGGRFPSGMYESHVIGIRDIDAIWMARHAEEDVRNRERAESWQARMRAVAS